MADRWLTPVQQRHWRAYLLGTTLLMERLDRDLRDRHGVSLPEYEILVRLSEAPNRSLRMAELANSVKNSRSRITHTVKRLQEAGYVVRRACESDGRGVIAVLTPEGFAKLETAAPDHVDSVRDALIDVVTAEELDTIGDAFDRVGQRLESGGLDPVLSARSAQIGA
jgi:DNA-binding MarR family transcriptional regulator